jgi:hypothetical protein
MILWSRRWCATIWIAGVEHAYTTGSEKMRLVKMALMQGHRTRDAAAGWLCLTRCGRNGGTPLTRTLQLDGRTHGQRGCRQLRVEVLPMVAAAGLQCRRVSPVRGDGLRQPVRWKKHAGVTSCAAAPSAPLTRNGSLYAFDAIPGRAADRVAIEMRDCRYRADADYSWSKTQDTQGRLQKTIVVPRSRTVTGTQS